MCRAFVLFARVAYNKRSHNVMKLETRLNFIIGAKINREFSRLFINRV